MRLLYAILESNYTEAIGWVLIHSVWQGLVVGGLLMLALYIFRNRTARLRYYLSFVALSAMMMAAVITLKSNLPVPHNAANNPTSLFIQAAPAQNDLSREYNVDSALPISMQAILLNTGINKHFRWIVTVWLFGLIIYFLRLSFGLYGNFRLRHSANLKCDSHWQKRTEKLMQQMQMTRNVLFRLSDRIASPVTIGFIKPVILIPASFLMNMPAVQIEAVIIHELAHIRRHDYLVNLIQIIIETFFFYHPVVWFISSRIRKERENICDDKVIGQTGDLLNYARALAASQQLHLRINQLAVGIANKPYPLLERIKRLQNKRTMKTKITEKLIAGGLILSACILLSFMIDGNNHFVKTDLESGSIKTGPVQDKKTRVVVVQTDDDSIKTEAMSHYVYTVDDAELDSLLEAQKELSRQVEKTMERVIDENEDALSWELKEDIYRALEELEHQRHIMGEITLSEKPGHQFHFEFSYPDDWPVTDSFSYDVHIDYESLENARRIMDSIDIDKIIAQAHKNLENLPEDIDIDI